MNKKKLFFVITIILGALALLAGIYYNKLKKDEEFEETDPEKEARIKRMQEGRKKWLEKKKQEKEQSEIKPEEIKQDGSGTE